MQNRLAPDDWAVHDWYRFVLAFPPHLVRTYLDRFGLTPAHTVLDPFCGTGTVVVECKKRGIAAVGLEAHPLACLAGRVKSDWSVAGGALLEEAEQIAGAANAGLAGSGISDIPPSSGRQDTETLRCLSPEREALLLKGSISPLPLHKALVLLDTIDRHAGSARRDHLRLALAKTLVRSASNLHFGPEVGVGPARQDAAVVGPWLANVRTMAADLEGVGHLASVPATVLPGDARRADSLLAPGSVDAVITSPPYPNEKDYTRTTRLESVVLGLVRSRADLRALKQGLLRSNTRGVYVQDGDDAWVAGHPEVQRLARVIDERRVALGKTSGFERLYARVTRLYFGGMARHLAGLRTVLRPGARLAYVVGDQASFLRVLIRTGEILAGLAASLGYQVEGIDLFRTRRATATRDQLREEVVLLRWPGAGPH